MYSTYFFKWKHDSGVRVGQINIFSNGEKNREVNKNKKGRGGGAKKNTKQN